MNISGKAGSISAFIVFALCLGIVAFIVVASKSQLHQVNTIESAVPNSFTPPSTPAEMNKNQKILYTNDVWKIELMYPSYLRLEDKKEGYETCHGEGAQSPTPNSPWTCGLKIYDDIYFQNQNQKPYFLSISAYFNGNDGGLTLRQGSDSPRVKATSVTFQGFQAKEYTVYVDDQQTQVASILYDIAVSNNYYMNIEAVLKYTSLTKGDIDEILSSLIIQKNVPKPKNLY